MFCKEYVIENKFEYSMRNSENIFPKYHTQEKDKNINLCLN